MDTILKQKVVNIITVPFSGGQCKDGVDDGPQKLLDHGLLRACEESGWSTTLQNLDCLALKPSNDPIIHNCRNVTYVSSVTRALSELTTASHQSGGLTLTIGGDHSLAIGSITGLLRHRPDSCVLWIDAHADINTPSSTTSGNLHGCPVSFLLGLATLPGFEFIDIKLLASRIGYIGLRDIDPPEREVIRDLGIAGYSMYHVDKYGIGQVVQMALDRINPGLKRAIHLSYDVDALDPHFVPATGTPVRGGLTFREGTFIAESIAETGKLVSMDLVEVNPNLRSAGPLGEVEVKATLDIAISLVRCALGETLL